jgi:hypothetical protein
VDVDQYNSLPAAKGLHRHDGAQKPGLTRPPITAIRLAAKDCGDAGIVEQVDRRAALGQVEQVLHARAVGSRPIGPPGLAIGRA